MLEGRTRSETLLLYHFFYPHIDDWFYPGLWIRIRSDRIRIQFLEKGWIWILTKRLNPVLTLGLRIPLKSDFSLSIYILYQICNKLLLYINFSIEKRVEGYFYLIGSGSKLYFEGRIRITWTRIHSPGSIPGRTAPEQLQNRKCANFLQKSITRITFSLSDIFVHSQN